MEKKEMKAGEEKKLQYAKPVLVKHGKLRDVTAGTIGSAGDRIVTPLGCTRLFA